jgi:prophage tail gpP-like protein
MKRSPVPLSEQQYRQVTSETFNDRHQKKRTGQALLMKKYRKATVVKDEKMQRNSETQKSMAKREKKLKTGYEWMTETKVKKGDNKSIGSFLLLLLLLLVFNVSLS